MVTNSLFLTWSTLKTQYSAASWSLFASLAQAYYAQQGRLLPAANYLALSPTTAAEPFIGSLEASELVRVLLPLAGPAEETYPQYVLRGTADEQPLLTVLTTVLLKRGIGLADFKQALATEQASYYLLALLGPEFWTPVTAAWQQQVQQRLDEAGRWQRLLDTQETEAGLRTALGALRTRLVAAYPGASLNSLSSLPLNELARALWSPAPLADDSAISELLQSLQTTARGVVAQNYLESAVTERFLAAISPDLLPFAQVLLTTPAGTPALTTVTELATADTHTLASQLVALPANHPVVYALGAWFQLVLQRFIGAETPALPIPPVDPLVVQGQLLGAGDSPLANFSLRLRQVVVSRQGAERALGDLRTGPDGRFVLTVTRDWYLNEHDELTEAPAHLRAAVYYPNQELTGEPALTLELATESTETTYPTDLLPTLPAHASGLLDSVALPDTLRQLLADQNIRTWEDVRTTGSLLSLITDLLPEDEEAAQAASRLEGLAQFDVVSPGATAFHEQVVSAGFYSPAQLLATVSQADFVERLAAANPADEALRTQAVAFYQQAAAVQALSQALGLLSASTPTDRAATTTAGFRAPAVMARFANVGQLANEGVIEGDTTTSAFSPITGDDTDAPTLPGYRIAEGFNAAPAGPELGYQPDGQCDCPACRSAVSPTAYLASLLKYAKENLKYDGGGFEAIGLQNAFLQPYCDLTLNCQSAEEQVCQYRLAIEVIQKYWRGGASPNPGDALKIADARPYVEGVLEALLQALGTSLTELRATTDATRAALASRLRLPTDLVSELQTRFAAAQLTNDRSLDALEADLAELFGLASTAVDPLCTGLLLTPPTIDDPIKLVRWALQGIEYGTNTDANGQLSIIITPGAKPHLTVYAGQLAEDNVVARGTLLESNSTTHTYTGLLFPQHGSGLRGSVVATVTGSEEATFTLAVVPAVTAGRQEVLVAEWLSQDAQAVSLLQAHGDSTPSWNGFTFLVDPDLLGPDDFRTLPQGNRAYQLWRRRYEFLQDLVAPGLLPLATMADLGGLGKLVDELTTHSLTYTSDNAGYVRIPWSTTALTDYAVYYHQSSLTGTAALAYLHADSTGTTAGAGLAANLLRSIGLSAEAMLRLYDLWQLNRTQVLGAADLQEALDIVRQSVKKRFEADWTAEEQLSANPVDLTTLLFQSAVHEPQTGIWQQVRPLEFGFTSAAQMPRIDPDEVTPLDLPDAGIGNQANQFWSDRQAELLQKRQAILASGTSATTPALRADAMLTYAYRANRFDVAPPAVLPGTPPSGLATFEAVVAASQNTADAQKNMVAQAYLAVTLSLRAAEAARLVELRAQVVAQPADTLWQEMAALLTLAWKRAVAYRRSYVPESTPAPTTGTPATSPQLYAPSWLTQEASVNAFQATPLDYVIGTRKHRLVKWRADVTTRTQWAQALALASQRPLIDPDQLVPGDFRQAGERSRSNYSPAVATKPYLNPAFELYQRRADEVAAKYVDLRDKWAAAQLLTPDSSRQQASWELINAQTFRTQAELQDLYRQQEAGADVSLLLRRLQLTPDGLTLLVTQANRLAPDRPEEVAHLLTQLYRQRRYATWAREEIALRIVPRRTTSASRRPRPNRWPRSLGAARRWSAASGSARLMLASSRWPP
jgi:hypothetical protein